MRLRTRLLQYFLVIYVCYCHDLNHADTATVKSSVSIENRETTQIEINENKNILNTVETVASSAQTHSQEQVKPISNEIENNNIIDHGSDQHIQVPFKSTDTPTVQTESHIPASGSSRILRSSTTKLHSQQSIHPRQVQTNDMNQLKNETVENSNGSEEVYLGIDEQLIKENNDIHQDVDSSQTYDLPRQVYIHDSESVLNQWKTSTDENLNKNPDQTTDSSVVNQDINTHLPRMHGTKDNETSVIDSTSETISNNFQINDDSFHNDSYQSFLFQTNSSLKNKTREICWHIPKKFESSIELLENQIFRFINILPEFIQTIFFARIEDREILMNTMWFISICSMCFLFSFSCLFIGTKRLKQSKQHKEVRTRCQQLQHYNNQIELERATFERQNQKLSDEIDEYKNLSVRDADEDIFALREECTRFQEDLKIERTERENLQQNIDEKQSLIVKYEFDIQRQIETVAQLNHEILQLNQELEKERGIVARLKSDDISLERFEKLQELLQTHKTEITQLKQEKFNQTDQFQEIQQQVNQLNVENNQLTQRMKQLKILIEQRNQTIKLIQEKLNDEESNENENLFSLLEENSSKHDEDFLKSIDNDVEKSNQHIRDLQNEINEKTRRINELDVLFKQEKDRCKELETKLKVVLELRERDAHLHIRQLGQTDAELRKARSDTERVRILQQQLELKQQQLDDVQKVLSAEQIKFTDETSKLQHKIHEKWMEVKRLTRENESSKKESESLRRQITKYANNERSSQEKSILKPHMDNNNKSEFENNSPVSSQQGENFRPIDHQRNDSGATSPSEMFIPRPTLFGMPRPTFFPTPFMRPPPPNPFLLHPGFPMGPPGPHGMISPVSHLINGNDGNNSEFIDPSNITPNSTSYDAQSNGAAASPVPDDEKPVKTKKVKKSLKKKTRTSLVKEDV